jgi:type II secretory pathway pseudopilin PulG
VTLIELLIVITIMLMVTAAAIPIMMPAVQNRQMRESSRMLSSYISGARSRAIDIGRPVGVMFERFNGQPFSMVASYVEVPPPYGGDVVNSRMKVSTSGVVNFMGVIETNAPDLADPMNNTIVDPRRIGLLRAGDIVRLDYKGPTYFITVSGLLPGQAITALPSATNWTLTPTSGAAVNVPQNYSTTGAPFQIFRQPIRSSAPPMQLPEGVVVDLVSSGVTISGAFGTPLTYNPFFTFSPNGAVDYVGIPGPTRPLGPLYFLVGRRELMPDINPNDLNLFDPNVTPKNQHLLNFWVAVDYQTGHVSVTENALNAATKTVQGARAFAQTRQSVGGR